MDNVLMAFRWTSAAVGIALLVTAAWMALTHRRGGPAVLAAQFGLALVMFNIAGLLTKEHVWSLASDIAGALLLVQCIRTTRKLLSR